MSSPLIRLLVICGLSLLVLAGALHMLKRLPGDIIIERDNFRFYFPLTTCLVLSVLLSLIFYILARLKH